MIEYVAYLEHRTKTSHLLTNRVFALPEERRVNLNKQRNNDHMSIKEHAEQKRTCYGCDDQKIGQTE